MNDQLSPSDVVVPEQDIDETPTQTDPPKPVSSGVWAMPEPVFKKTSGYLPQGFNVPFEPHRQGDENTTVEQPKPDIEPQIATADHSTPEVEPQPDVLADIGLEPALSAIPASPQKKKGVVGRIVMVLLALAIIVLMAAVVVGVVWFVFWPRPDATIN